VTLKDESAEIQEDTVVTYFNVHKSCLSRKPLFSWDLNCVSSAHESDVLPLYQSNSFLLTKISYVIAVRILHTVNING
jgi:hypothetical protein